MSVGRVAAPMSGCIGFNIPIRKSLEMIIAALPMALYGVELDPLFGCSTMSNVLMMQQPVILGTEDLNA